MFRSWQSKCFVFLLFLWLSGVAEAKGKPKRKCDFEPLDIYEKGNRLAYKRYSSENLTYASLLEEWWKLIDSVEEGNVEKIRKKEQSGPVRYLVSDEDDDETWYVPEGTFIFLNSGRLRIWGSEYVNETDPSAEADPSVQYLSGLKEDFLKTREAAVLYASIRGTLEIPLFNKKRLDCYVDGCEIKRCEDYLVATNIFQFEDLLWWGEDSPNEFVRSHGYVLLLPNDLEPGMRKVETRGHTKNFLYPIPDPEEREWSYTYNICVGDKSQCTRGKKGKGKRGKRHRRGLGGDPGDSRRRLEEGWNTRIAYADWV